MEAPRDWAGTKEKEEEEEEVKEGFFSFDFHVSSLTLDEKNSTSTPPKQQPGLHQRRRRPCPLRGHPVLLGDRGDGRRAALRVGAGKLF